LPLVVLDQLTFARLTDAIAVDRYLISVAAAVSDDADAIAAARS